MSLRTFEALLIVSTAACGAASVVVATPAPGPAPAPAPALASAALPPASAATPGSAQATAASSSSPPGPGPLPPPRSATLPLSSGNGEPGDAELALGDQAFDRGDLAGAERSYQAARSASASTASAVGISRVRLARVGVPLDYGAAKGNAAIAAIAADLARAAKASPSFGPAFVELGRARLLLGDAPGAMDALKRGVQLLDDEPEAHSQLGVAWLATGQVDDAVRELERAADLDPGSIARRGNLGTALMMAGRTKEAIAQYEATRRKTTTATRARTPIWGPPCSRPTRSSARCRSCSAPRASSRIGRAFIRTWDTRSSKPGTSIARLPSTEKRFGSIPGSRAHGSTLPRPLPGTRRRAATRVPPWTGRGLSHRTILG